MHENTTGSDVKLLKVSKVSSPQAVATAISKSITESYEYPCVRAIGHGAVGQAVKAIGIARGYVAPRGIDLACIIGFETLRGNDGDDISAMCFTLFQR